MTADLVRPRWPLVAFAAVTAAAYVVGATVVVPALATVAQPEVLAAALAVDLAVLVPLAYAWLVVGVRGGRWASVLPVVALSAAGAWAVLPEAHAGVLAPLAVLVPVLELGAVALVVGALVRAARRPVAGDALDRLRAATARVLGDGAASRALAYELAIVRYALGRTEPPSPGAFPARRGYGALLAGVSVAAALELVGGHLLVMHLWGEVAALVHLALSGYAILWLIGDWRALGARVTTLDDGVLRVRCGLRWSADVPLDAVEAVYHVRKTLPADRPTLDASPMRSARFALDLARPVVAEGPYGLRKKVTRVALGADDPHRLLAALADALGGEVR